MEGKDTKSHKKSKKTKLSKKSKTISHENVKAASLKRKQTEVARVLQLKAEMLLKGNLSYLEYIELREEVERLNNLRESFTQRAAEIASQAK